jgi:hypothetical protein
MGQTYIYPANGAQNWYQQAVNAANDYTLNDSSRSRLDLAFTQTQAVFSGSPQVQTNGVDLGYSATGPYLLGQADPWVYNSDSTSMAFVEVDINTNYQVNWASNNQPGPYTLDEQQTVAHELGHAVGLDHLVAGPNITLMQCQQTEGEAKNSLGGDEIQGISYLYTRHQWDFQSPTPRAC